MVASDWRYTPHLKEKKSGTGMLHSGTSSSPSSVEEQAGKVYSGAIEDL